MPLTSDFLTQANDLDPANAAHEGDAAFRGEAAGIDSPVLSMLAAPTQRSLASNLAHHVFPASTAESAWLKIRRWLEDTPMGVFTSPALDHIAAVYAWAWFPQTNPRP